MKLHLFAAAFLLCLPLTAQAAETAQSSTRSSATWIEERGATTTDDVVSTLGIAPTSEQRAQIDIAVAERNEALREINAKFSASLQKTLAANDSELAKHASDEKERRRMELIRRRQPARYNGMKKK